MDAEVESPWMDLRRAEKGNTEYLYKGELKIPIVKSLKGLEK